MRRARDGGFGIAMMTCVVSVIVSGCDKSDPAGSPNTNGQGGASAAAAGASGTRVDTPMGGEGGERAATAGQGGSTGGSDGDSTVASLGGAPSTTGGNATAGGNVTTGGNAAGGNTTTGGNATAGGTSAWVGSAGSPGLSACSRSVGDYCACMPRFLGTQVMDGVGDEFAPFTPMVFALSSAAYVDPRHSSPLPETVTLRAAWSEIGLHVHVHVEDPSIVPDTSASLWNGDNVQLFAAPTGDLTGRYTGTEDGGAIHVLISAPDSADTSRAVVIYQDGVATNTPFVTGLYATRRVPGGYEVEAQLQWLAIAEPLSSGGHIGFDLLVGAASDSSSGLALEGGLANNPVSGSSPACELGGRVQPGCDDRTWCRPLLQ